jgi:hypothetical protein
MTPLQKAIQSFDTKSRVYSQTGEEDKAMIPLEFSSGHLILISRVLKFLAVET